MDSNLVQLLVQGGFAALFVWLLIDTQRKSEKREERLMSIVDRYGESLPKIVEALERIEKRLEAK